MRRQNKTCLNAYQCQNLLEIKNFTPKLQKSVSFKLFVFMLPLIGYNKRYRKQIMKTCKIFAKGKLKSAI